MQLDQVLIRPGDAVVLIQHTDSAGRSGTVMIELKSSAPAGKLLEDCQALLPPETADRPDAPAIEAEISQLEGRIAKLRASIGQ